MGVRCVGARQRRRFARHLPARNRERGSDSLRIVVRAIPDPERISPPDIDIISPTTGGADVIEYVRQKYGRDPVAQIITFGTMGAKSVVRDVGRVMGLPLWRDCDRLAKMIPFDLECDAREALKQSPEFKAGLRDRGSHA